MKGLGTALITPFKADKSIDFDALAQLLDKQLAGGVDYLVVLGTTAETATLSIDEKRAVREFVVERVKSQESRAKTTPLVLGIGGNNTANVVREIQETDLSPFAAILSVCPYYNKPSQEGLFQHFSAIAEACPIPIILYNVPGRTGVNLLPETVMRIYHAHPDKIIGIKEASGNVEQIKTLIALSQATIIQRSASNDQNPLHIISGDDGIAHELISAGAVGLISVASNAFPADFSRLVHNINGEGAQIQAQYQELIHLLFVEGNPSGIKTVLSQQGLIENELRLPLVANSDSVQAQIKEAIQR